MNSKFRTLLVALALVAGITNNTSAQTTYTGDLSYASQSAFRLFGSTASTNSIGTLDFTVERNGWSAEFIFVDGFGGDQNEGDLVRYYDDIFKKSWTSGKFSASVGVEIFYGPAQLGSDSSTFIAPLATTTWKPNDHFSLELGGQWVGTHNTEYTDQDRFFAWLQPTLSHSIGRLSASVSPGYIAADTGRSTLYMSGDLVFGFNDHISVYASYLEARSWGVVGVPGMVPIDGTWTGGVTIGF